MPRILSVAVLVALMGCSSEPAAERPPNFVIIFIDDLGYGDIGPFGSKINNTPHLDRMAAEGMTLTSFYSAAPVCSPSRAALMTGSYPKRVGLAKGSRHSVLLDHDHWGLHPAEVTIAEMLKEQGYATGCFGKWHLGDQPQFLPTEQGFDEYFGIPYSNDLWAHHPRNDYYDFSPLPVMRDAEVVGEVKDMHDQSQLCLRFTEAAVSFIRSHQDEPFFVYLPHAFVHHPRGTRDEFLKRSQSEQTGSGEMDWGAVLDDPGGVEQRWRTRAQIEEVDWSAGQVLDTLHELGLAENTMVVFTSDNGGASGCVNLPLRGGKGSTWEGGMREPSLAWWPGRIPAGSVSDEIMSTMDLLPTIAGFSGAQVPQDRTIDGKDVSRILPGEPDARTPHEAFSYYRQNEVEAVRSGEWKLFRTTGALYNLKQDIGETTDVAADNPEVVARLNELLNEAVADLGDGADDCPNCRPVGVDDDPQPLIPYRDGRSTGL